MDIIEQLEQGKKMQEEEGIDTKALRTKVKESETTNKAAISEDPFTQAEQIIEQTTEEKEHPKTKVEESANAEKEEKYPGFNFNDYYEKGQKIFFIRILEPLGYKEFMELTIRTIYPKTIIGFEKKHSTQSIGPDAADMIFTDRVTALDIYDQIKLEQPKYKNTEDDLGDLELENVDSAEDISINKQEDNTNE